MCGIIGSINFSLNSTILADLAHRGPDDQGWKEFRVFNHDVVLGHTRLAIQDKSLHGHQPMLGNAGALVFNGEIYNHLELRKRISDHIFEGHSDTETLLSLLEKNADSVISDLNGIFAFAFLDERRKRLLLVRDSFGIKPLYYARLGNSLVFCSEIAPIAKMVGNDIDIGKLGLALRYRSNYAPDTIYRRIRKLLPGNCLEVDLSGEDVVLSTRRFSASYSDDLKISRQEAVEAYSQELLAAVKRQLLSDIEIGVFLSGGIDSALIASFLTHLLAYQPKAFTVGFEGEEESEIEDARLTARHLGLEHHALIIQRKDFFSLFSQAAQAVEEPTSTTSIVPMYALAKLASQRVHVVLSGQGADECSAGYARYRAERLFNPLTWSASNILCRLSKRPHRLVSYLSHRDELRRYLSSHQIFSKTDVQNLLGTRVKEDLSMADYPHRFTDAVNRMIGYDLRFNLPDDLLLYTDKITMRFSLECRVPFLDNELVRLLMSLPGKLKANLRGGKLLHKDVARTFLPNFLVQRKKKGFLVPTNAWFRESREHWEILLDSQGTFGCTFDRRWVESVLKRHQAGENLEKQIMLLMSCRAIMSAT